jgi:hypothetical protein
VSAKPETTVEWETRWAQWEIEHRAAERTWIAELRAKNVTAAHPDDGWVDRTRDEVLLCYPQFDDGLKVGDLLALGDQNSYRLVRVVSSRNLVLGGVRFKFEKIESGLS